MGDRRGIEEDKKKRGQEEGRERMKWGCTIKE